MCLGEYAPIGILPVSIYMSEEDTKPNRKDRIFGRLI
jgi:hypothetical protein